MSFGIGNRVEVITVLYLGRWISPLEKGEVVGREVSPVGQELYRVKLETDNTTYAFAPSEIDEVSITRAKGEGDMTNQNIKELEGDDTKVEFIQGEESICYDCYRDRDRCPDCCDGDLYVSPDDYERYHDR